MKAIEALKISSEFHFHNDKVEIYARIENAAQNGHFSITVFALSQQMEQDLIDNGYLLERNSNEDGVVETIDIVWQYVELQQEIKDTFKEYDKFIIKSVS